MPIVDQFSHLRLSPDQVSAVEAIEKFLGSDQDVFLLKGYAGSGKTTLLKGLIGHLQEASKSFSLWAPTGRAAKILREKAGHSASTIHRGIYSYSDLRTSEEGDSFKYYFGIKEADLANHVFIVDEASMVSDAKSEGEFFRFGSGHLLSDLVRFGQLGNRELNNKIIFVGDPCQLPPVGDNNSKALDASYLEMKFGLAAVEVEMREVKRQGAESAILKEAAKLRYSLSSGFFNSFHVKPAPEEIIPIGYAQLIDTYQAMKGSKILMAYKNKTCLQLNKAVREAKYGNPDLPLQKGDWLIFGANNYSKGVFNGEFAAVHAVDVQPISRKVYFRGKSEEPVVLTWRKLELIVLSDQGEPHLIKGQILENFLLAEQQQLSSAETRALYVDFCQRNPKLKPKTEEFKMAIRDDEYFNCLMVKYGYAITCHKAQGGEWDNVLTIWDHDIKADFNSFLDTQTKSGKTNDKFYRWAYTAITRSSKKLFLLNPPVFHPYQNLLVADAEMDRAIAELGGKAPAGLDIDLDEKWLATLEKYGLKNQDLSIQDHFISTWQFLSSQEVKVVKWERKGYEIVYGFSKGDKKAAIKTWINGKNKFKGTFQVIPKLTPDAEFGVGLIGLLEKMPTPHVNRVALQAVVAQVEFDMQVQEEFPFLLSLFEDLSQNLPGLAIEVSHFSYKERYAFLKGGQKAVFDVIYDGKGFFGTATPLLKESNSPELLQKVGQVFKSLR